MKNIYIFKYLNKLSNLIVNFSHEDFLEIVKILKEIKRKKKKVILVGNGGSAAMASHVSVDLTKICKIRAINFNEADLLTCFANDYGYENWLKKACEVYIQKNDMVILISSSGNSPNIIKTAKYLKKNKIGLITFSGFNNNKLKKLGTINLWCDSNSYNIIEMTHYIWLVSIIDFLKSFWSTNNFKL